MEADSISNNKHINFKSMYLNKLFFKKYLQINAGFRHSVTSSVVHGIFKIFRDFKRKLVLYIVLHIILLF